MRPSADRPQTLRQASTLRPKVSFNRAVHVKRISRKERTREDAEEDQETVLHAMPANGLKPAGSKFSTLPSSRQRNGVTKTPSERLSRLMRPEEEQEARVRSEGVQKQGEEAAPARRKKTLAERVRAVFGGGKKKPGRTPTLTRDQQSQDELRTRYAEFRGRASSSDATDNEQESYRGKRRGSAPESRGSWFRSLERIKKTEREDTEERQQRPLQDSSPDSATEQEGMGSRAPSLVYLHTAAVGDIPQRRSEPPSKRLSRSVSVLAPWAPRLRAPRGLPPSRAKSPGLPPSRAKSPGLPPSRAKSPGLQTPSAVRSRATQTESPTPVRPAARLEPQRALPKLVFTGPRLEDALSGRAGAGRAGLHAGRRR